MSFLKSLGRIALQAAPYVAAPFTGGASLLAAPIANNLASRIDTGSPGLNRGLGYAGDVASFAGGAGAFGKLGGARTPPFVPSSTGGATDQGYSWQKALGSILGGTNSSARTPPFAGNLVATEAQRREEQANADKLGGLVGGLGDLFRRNGNSSSSSSSSSSRNPADDYGSYSSGSAVQRDQPMRGLGPVMGARDQSSPNLALSIGAGRQDAIRNQPFRRGYDTLTQGPDDSVITSRNPRISVGRNR